jgi:hypothetical protein
MIQAASRDSSSRSTSRRTTMAITQLALARAMARDLARAAPPEAGIKRIWVWSQHGYVDPERDYVALAVPHDPLDEETMHRFLGAVTTTLDDRHPEVNKLLHTFTSDGLGDLDVEEELRPGSEEVGLSGE